MPLTIVIPMYNEEKRIVHLVTELKQFLSVSHACKVHFLLVDDGSKDRTKDIATSLVDNHEHIKVVGYEKNAGKGAAVVFGMKMAESDYVGFMDADVATPMTHIDHVIKILKQENPDFLIGDRRPTARVYKSFIRTFSSMFFNIIAHLPLRKKYRDTQCGFKFYSKRFSEEVIKLSKIQNFAFDIEHLMIAETVGCQVRNYPIQDWENGDNSKVNLIKDGMKMSRSCFAMLMSRSEYQKRFNRLRMLQDKKRHIVSKSA